ncbi:membrane protein insertase YidC [Desulfatitalea alkaliphila]|nr:membrane protein insertase YidC [Desulfatitalea alkaliphila]
MEQTRLLMAIGISFLVFFLWSVFFAPPPPAPVSEQPTSSSPRSPASPAEATVSGPEQVGADVMPAAGDAVTAARQARNIVVDTPLFRMTLSERGGSVVSMVLKEYLESMESNGDFKELVEDNLQGGTALLRIEGATTIVDEGLLFDAGETPDRIVLTGSQQDVRLVHDAGNGVRIARTFRFYPDSYLVDMAVEVQNNSPHQFVGDVALVLRHPDDALKTQFGFQGPSGLVNNKREQVKLKKIDEQAPLEGRIRWVSIETLYFMESVLQKDDVDARMVVQHRDKIVENSYVFPTVVFAPGTSERFSTSLFMGPKSLKVLRSVGNDLDRVIHFGWVDFIAKPCLWFMNFIYKFIPNYGIAIIILTIITRLLFWPLAQKSYKSMNEMRKLQPLMQEIREKYKDDRARMNQETMALYRTYKINPLGGCLPMVIQLPVFFALYRMLYQAIELRHAPFFGWISDLSAPDRLFNFGFSIPFMQEPSGIPVLTLIMGASMFFQMKMSPAPGDPLQAKMMMLMPIVFTFIFINFPSGLVLYWLVSNLVSMAQQYYTLKKLA